MKKLVLSLISVTLLCSATFAQNRIWAEKMANTIMKQYPDSMVVMKYTSQVDKQESQETAKPRPANWNYEIGVVLMGFERLWRSSGDIRYQQYIQHIVDKFITEDGKIRTFAMEDYNLDNIPTGRQLLSLHQIRNEAKYRKAADLLRNQLAWQPRNRVGGFWHKLRYPTQMWLDGLYMGEPFYAEYAQMTGRTEDFEDIANQFVWMEKYARDEKTGLLYHGWDESHLQKWANKETGKSPEFWSRAMGWYIMGLVDVLDVFPKDHPRRPELVAILNRLSTALVKFQDTNSGVWWQVTDKGGKEGNYLESSGSAMFVYGLAKAVRRGYIPETYLPAVKKGFDGLIKTFVETDEQGLIHYTKAVGGAGLGGNPYRDGTYEYYIKEPTRTDDLKAIGPFMQACVEMDMLEKLAVGKGQNVVIDNYFNNEYRNGLKFHYLWNDRFDSGYSFLGTIFNDFGANTSILSAEPSRENLKNADVFIIVDPDTKKETQNPNFIKAKNIQTLKEWVVAGGTLVLLANDTTNCEIKNFNELTKAFGIEFTGKNRNMVKNDQYEQGTFTLSGNHPIFKDAKKIYVKELVTLSVKSPATAVLEEGGDVIMATSKVGKGTVFVLGDPWIYNEYLNGRKLPADFENFKAAQNWAEWLLTRKNKK
jgi:unsaturated rhamnogalacturonyl hydrolase